MFEVKRDMGSGLFYLARNGSVVAQFTEERHSQERTAAELKAALEREVTAPEATPEAPPPAPEPSPVKPKRRRVKGLDEWGEG